METEQVTQREAIVSTHRHHEPSFRKVKIMPRNGQKEKQRETESIIKNKTREKKVLLDKGEGQSSTLGRVRILQ